LINDLLGIFSMTAEEIAGDPGIIARWNSQVRRKSRQVENLHSWTKPETE
jgi:hypothetical protein